MRPYLVIFGAAVHADGSPSGTLKRRVAGALAIGRTLPGACYLPTGGAGANGQVEADAMVRMLREAGVQDSAILPEREARDTLESIWFCDALLRRQDDVAAVIPCTSPYHIPRCALLLRLRGWPVQMRSMPGDKGFLPARKLIWYYLKEVIALPYDVLLLILGRRGKTGQ